MMDRCKTGRSGSIISIMLCLSAAILIILSGCASEPVDTGLYTSGRYTGAVSIFRVGELKKEGDTFSPRFSRVLGKDDAYDTAVPSTIVTSDDFVTISMDYAFIKYFVESDISADLFDDEDVDNDASDRKGEVAVVLSFDAGTEKRDSLVVFSSKGQTLGSMLGFNDWPVIGPLKIDGDVLKMRIVMIEMDSGENEQIKQFTRSIAGLATVANPSAAGVFKVTQPIVETILALNKDDVILDQKVGFQRIDKYSDRRDRSSTGPTPLMIGQYAIILQEDELRGVDVGKVASVSLRPVVSSSMRYDHDTDRLYNVYPYWADGIGWVEIYDENKYGEEIVKAFSGVCTTAANDDRSRLAGQEDLENKRCEIDLANEGEEVGKEPGPKKAKSNDLALVYAFGGCRNLKYEYQIFPDHYEIGKTIRKDVLGYDDNSLNAIDNWYCLDEALHAAYCDALRGEAKAERGRTDSSLQADESESAGEDSFYREPNAGCDVPKGARFSYPVVVYPDASVVLAQYPLHTHIVLSVSRSLGGAGAAVHENFQSYEDFVKQQIDSARDNDLSGPLATQLINGYVQHKQQKTVLRKVAVEDDPNEKVCLLYDGIKDGAEDDTKGREDMVWYLNDAPLYNEIYHATGEYMTSVGEIEAYLKIQCESSDECSCYDRVVSTQASGEQSAGDVGDLSDNEKAAAFNDRLGDEDKAMVLDKLRADGRIDDTITSVADEAAINAIRAVQTEAGGGVIVDGMLGEQTLPLFSPAN